MLLKACLTCLLVVASTITLGCVQGTPSKGEGDSPSNSAIAGAWKITYAGGSVRNYVIFDNGEVKYKELDRTGTLQRAKVLLLDFGDGKVERLSLAGSRLLVEHFNPKSDYPNNRPNEIGIGVRAVR